MKIQERIPKKTADPFYGLRKSLRGHNGIIPKP